VTFSKTSSGGMNSELGQQDGDLEPTGGKTKKVIMSEIFAEAVMKFVKLEPSLSLTFKPAKGSVNNVIRFVYFDEKSSESPQYLLRIYNNGNNLKKIQFEHLILEKLRSYHLDYQIPVALRSLDKDETIERLSDGSYASLFHVISGELPGLHLTREIGRASGQLSLIFQDLSMKLTSEELSMISTRPYYDLYGVHESISREIFLEEANSILYQPCREEMNYLIERVLELESKLCDSHHLQLPIQLIHGDLHYDNVLVLFSTTEAAAAVASRSDDQIGRQSGIVSAILDYEFCAMDWKAMELAICLSKYLAQPEPFLFVIDFVEGYAEGSRLNSGPYLSSLECELLPSLIELRILSNVVFFVGRIKAQQESVEILTGGKAGDYCQRLRWIEQNRERLVETFQKAFELKE
jgi:homoserine kinase type II